MSALLDKLPEMNTFLGVVDLKTGSLIIAAISIIHPMAYGCMFFVPMSYLLVTVWTLVALFAAASVGLFFGVITNAPLACTIWIWCSCVFQVLMIVLMLLLIIVFASRGQRNRILAVVIGLVWYLLTIYFILVVNSYRKQLVLPVLPALPKAVNETVTL